MIDSPHLKNQYAAVCSSSIFCLPSEMSASRERARAASSGGGLPSVDSSLVVPLTNFTWRSPRVVHLGY